MNYYKIIKNGNVIDVNYVYLKYQKKHNVLLVCDPKESSFIQSSDGNTVWIASWLLPVPDDLRKKYNVITLDNTQDLYAVEITEDEYNAIHKDIKNWREPVKKTETTDTETRETIMKETSAIGEMPMERLNKLEENQEQILKLLNSLNLKN